MNPFFAVFGLGPTEILILLGVGVLLFGRNLPGVGRSLGKTIVEFKKGVKGMEDDLEGGNIVRQEPAAIEQQPRPPQRVSTTAPKFVDDSAAVTTPPQA